MKKELSFVGKTYFPDIKNNREKPWYVEMDASDIPAHTIFSGEGKIMGTFDSVGQLYFYEHHLSRSSELKDTNRTFDISSYDGVHQAVRLVFLLTQEEGAEVRKKSERLQNRILKSRLDSKIRREKMRNGKK